APREFLSHCTKEPWMARGGFRSTTGRVVRHAPGADYVLRQAGRRRLKFVAFCRTVFTLHVTQRISLSSRRLEPETLVVHLLHRAQLWWLYRVSSQIGVGVGFNVPVAPNAPRNCEEVELELELQEH